MIPGGIINWYEDFGKESGCPYSTVSNSHFRYIPGADVCQTYRKGDLEDTVLTATALVH